MAANKHLNWGTYRRQISDVVEDNPDLAVAHVQHNFPKFYRCLLEADGDEDVLDTLFKVRFDIATADISDHEWKYFDDGVYSLFRTIRDDPHPTVAIMQDFEYDDDFLSSYDAENMRNYDLREALASYNQYTDDTRVITFPNGRLALLWIEEIAGQISDGMWENRDVGWEQWCNAEVVIDTDMEEVEFAGHFTYDIDFSEVLTSDGMCGRMIYYMRASGIDEDYDMDDLEEDIGVLNDGC